MKRRIDTVIDFVKEIREDFPDIKDEDLYDDGKIYYMNGNDSTKFDWSVNYRLCEFTVFGKNEMGFITVYVNRDDTISANVWKDFGLHATNHYDKRKLPNGFSRSLKRSIMRATHSDDLYDEPLNKLYKM